MHLSLHRLVPCRQPHASLRVGLVRNVPLRVRMVILWRGRQLECVPTVETGLEKTMQYVQVTVSSVSVLQLL